MPLVTPPPYLSPPPAIVQQLGEVKRIDRFTALPVGIQKGAFRVDGFSAAGWKMAEPGGPFSATDEPIPGAPGRRLIFAACNPQLCLIHYEKGGVQHMWEILALSLGAHGWSAIWNATGPHAIANLDSMRAMLRGQASAARWSEQWVKGDF